MGLCKFSGLYGKRVPLLVDSTFITEYMPHADFDATKVYLLGLELCFDKNESSNTLEAMAQVLSFSEERVVQAFEYWQNLGLVQIVAREPLEVRYLPVESGAGNLKKYKTDKYHDFNVMLQSILCGREILPNEFNEYYYFLESRHFEPEAFLSVVRYCTLLKDDKVRYPYVLAVAKSFAEDGILTEKAVNEKLVELENVSDELKCVFTALGIKRAPDPDERKMYLKWTKAFGFNQNVILFVARKLKGQGISKLDAQLLKYYQSKLFSVSEIENYTESEEQNELLAKDITRTIGVYYQNLGNVIDTYILEWLRQGYDRETLMMIASYCFKNSIRTLEGMNNYVQKFYKLGLVSQDAIMQYTQGVAGVDQKIAAIIEKCGLVRNVNSWDRDFYHTWTYEWKMPHEVIEFAATKAKGKEQPMAYLNKLLSSMYNDKFQTLADAKVFLGKIAGTQSANDKNITHELTEQEITCLFDNIKDIEI